MWKHHGEKTNGKQTNGEPTNGEVRNSEVTGVEMRSVKEKPLLEYTWAPSLQHIGGLELTSGGLTTSTSQRDSGEGIEGRGGNRTGRG